MGSQECTGANLEEQTHRNLSQVPVCVCAPKQFQGSREGLTKQRGFPPVSIPNLNVVIPTQAAFVQVHGGEVQDDLEQQRARRSMQFTPDI